MDSYIYLHPTSVEWWHWLIWAGLLVVAVLFHADAKRFAKDELGDQRNFLRKVISSYMTAGVLYGILIVSCYLMISDREITVNQACNICDHERAQNRERETQ